MDDERYYRVFLIWVRDAPVFARYLREVAEVARRYGGVERSLAPKDLYGERLTLPDILNVAYVDSPAARDAMDADLKGPA